MTALHLIQDEPLDFEAAVLRLRPRLQRFAARRLGDLHEAEELVQEALLRACSQRLATEDELAAWCHVVTSRLVLDRLRVRGRTVTVSEVPEGDRRQRDTADVVVARDEARTALDALDALIPRQAAVLWAREVEGASYDEIGLRFGMTEPAVRSVLMRARKALRQEYAARGGTLPHAGLALLAPWAGLHGLSALASLHRAATKGSALSVAAIGVAALGGLMLLPGQPPTSDPALSRPTQTTAAEVTQVTQPRALRPAGTALAQAVDRTAAPPASPARSALAPLARTCGVTAAGAGAGGSDCSPKARTYLYVRTPVNAGPVGVREVGVRTNDYDCARFPTNPLLACRTGETR